MPAAPQNPDAVENFRAGNEKVMGFLVGQVMKAYQGRAHSQMVQEVLKGLLTKEQ